MRRVNRIQWIFVVFLTAIGLLQAKTRKEIAIPDIPDYVTLKCDFHMHTVFSDGLVWPTVRVDEAWEEGLDAISITDHVEYRPHKEDVKDDLNRPYELAKQRAKSLGLILIHGAEITRSMPPGHMNAIFLKDTNALVTEKWQDAVDTAVRQGAFIFYNHPGWKGQQPDGISRWYDEHTDLLGQNKLMGVEVVNTDEYYPRALDWCFEKKLTIMGNSDIHDPILSSYYTEGQPHRPVTLVFAKSKTAEGIHEALLERRTAVYFEDKLIGEEKFLKAVFRRSIQVLAQEVSFQKSKNVIVQLHNSSDVPFELTAVGDMDHVGYPQHLSIPAHRTVGFQVSQRDASVEEEDVVQLLYQADNLIISSKENAKVDILLRMNK